jgi:hypothetical protein
MKNWKTTLSGIVASVGLALTNSPSPTTHIVGVILSSLGALLFGMSAKDKDVTGGTRQQ